MSNMSCCQFRDTYSDLLDCYESMDNVDLSEEEEKAKKKIIQLCQEIADDYGYND